MKQNWKDIFTNCPCMYWQPCKIFTFLSSLKRVLYLTSYGYFLGVKELENAKWRLIYQNNIHGKRVFGSKSRLIMAALSGAHIRVGFTDVLEVFDEAKNVYIHSKSNVISAELSFNLLSQWVYVIVDTNGNHLKRRKENHLIS